MVFSRPPQGLLPGLHCWDNTGTCAQVGVPLWCPALLSTSAACVWRAHPNLGNHGNLPSHLPSKSPDLSPLIPSLCKMKPTTGLEPGSKDIIPPFLLNERTYCGMDRLYGNTVMLCRLGWQLHTSVWRWNLACQGAGKAFLESQEKAVVLRQKTRW